MARLPLLVLPLGLDTFAVAAALGAAGLPPTRRIRVGLLLAGFEAAMPMIGLACGLGVESAAGRAAEWIAAGLLAALALRLLAHGEDLPTRVPAGGPALLALGFAVSVDELAVGLAGGLLELPLAALVAAVALQAAVLSQVGLRVGGRLGEALPGRAERAAGAALLALAVLLALERL